MLRKLYACTEDLNAWGRALRRRYREGIDKCKARIEELRGVDTEFEAKEALELRNKLATLLFEDETFWKQRAKFFG